MSSPHSSLDSKRDLTQRDLTQRDLTSATLTALSLLMFVSACERDPIIISKPLELDLSPCVTPLALTQDMSCAQGTAPEPQGCFLIERSQGGSVSLPVVWREGQLFVAQDQNNELEAAISDLNEQPTPAALMFLEEGADSSCRGLSLQSECTRANDCAVLTRFLLKEYELGRASVVAPEGQEALCEWLTPGAPDERCDGLDNDCDERVDEGFLDEACEPQGEGVCQVQGVKVCDGFEATQCVYPTPPAPTAERCDGLDNDCDGRVDEEPQELFEPCVPEGSLLAVGTASCEGGVLRCSSEERCDELDNDLDGVVDEGFEVGVECEAGVGTCKSRGVTRCVSLDNIAQIGAEGEAEVGAVACFVNALIQPTLDERTVECDGLDNDCDGFVDEHFIEQATSCGEGECAAAGLLSCVAGLTVDSCQPREGAELDQICDGVDEDCDGLIDEDFLSSDTYCGVGECRRQGRVYCINNDLVNTCRAPTSGAALDEVCDGRDADCDGVVDEDYTPQEVSCGVGACLTRIESRCLSGRISAQCQPSLPIGEDDNCDGVDDDCDGLTDEGFITQTITCGTGVCAQQGVRRCERAGGNSQLITSCIPLPPEQTDGCDGLDNDCDGRTDEGFLSSAISCGVGACEQPGNRRCVQGAVVSNCFPLQPQTTQDLCDGVDEDCDGVVDEDSVTQEELCDVPPTCQVVRLTTCLEGEQINGCEGDFSLDGAVSCAGGVCNTECDGVDDDCDGAIDEDFVLQLNPDESVCDGVDDDCDGEVDEDYQPQVITCGQGLCANSVLTYCELGQVQGACTPNQALQSPDTSCDGLDQDCDGLIDESYVTNNTLCGVGACQSSGRRVCLDGELFNSCQPGAPSDDQNCNGVDDDCDGLTDEGYTPNPIACGVGACVTQGQTRCTAVGVQDDCTPLQPAERDALCDGVDEDCDGRVDEDYAGYTISCGEGVCANTGVTTCVDGQVNTNVCTPSAPTALSDDRCDGYDDDCDGVSDEDYNPQIQPCEEGACTLSAPVICTAEGLKNTCAYDFANTDAVCDGADEDCDGVIDEDYQAQPLTTQCGQGVCARNAELVCLSGAAVSVCVPGTPTGDDISCDGLDDDCDGLTDEGYEVSVECGVGACRAQGVERCVGGETEVECTEGTPSTERCDGLDNDCDGLTDEGFNIGEACFSGLGECARPGVFVCTNPTSSACNATPAPADIEECDGLDNDCDGEVDNNPTDAGSSCLVPGLENTLCEVGINTCEGGALRCVSVVSPNQFEEAYCTVRDEDCDSSTPAIINTSTRTPDVPYLDQLYDVKLYERCSSQHKNCKWRCESGELVCKRKAGLCPADRNFSDP